MITYELAKQLKEAGFPQNTFEYSQYINEDNNIINYYDIHIDENWYYVPILSELIETYGDDLRLQTYYSENYLMWQADTCCNFQEYDNARHIVETGSTPE